MNMFTVHLVRLSAIMAILLTMQSCSKSLVYSPALNLPSKPLKQNETDIHAAVELFPETRPSANGSLTSTGISASLGYGFTEKFSMAGRIWFALQSGILRSGISINGHFIRRIDDDQRIIILPRLGVALEQNTIQGYGVSVSSVYSSKFTEKTAIYGGAGLLWGFHHLEQEVNALGTSKTPMGFGLLMHTGFIWDLTPSIRVNMEINPIYQINTFDNSQQFIVSPSLGFGYTFHK